jgi:ABC-type antimicrobial peptide transport system permease subunit
MKKFYALFRLGVKYLYRYRRRYGFLLAAIVFGFTVVTYITSLRDGMYDNVYYSAQSHYAGDVVAVGYDDETRIKHLGQEEIPAILSAAHDFGINAKYTVMRTLFGDTGIVYFNGNAIRLKYVNGCDWEKEEHLFYKMDFVFPPQQDIGDDGIILSEPVALDLGAVMGDSVVLETETRYGQKNTSVFIVRGIVRDASIFGYYKVYLSRLSLNRLLLFDDNDCSIIGFFLDNPASSEKSRARLQKVLQERIQTSALVYDRVELDREEDKPFNGIKVFLITMPVYLSVVSDLMGAMSIITYFLYGMMLIIILVSAAVTYRLILHERAREMGIMRSIGFYGGDLRFVLWVEVIVLGIISLFAGIILSWILSRISLLLSFSWFPSFEIFMKNERISVLYLPKTVSFNVILIYLTLVAAVFIPALQTSKKQLPVLLSGETI